MLLTVRTVKKPDRIHDLGVHISIPWISLSPYPGDFLSSYLPLLLERLALWYDRVGSLPLELDLLSPDLLSRDLERCWFQRR
jgi:hypothetical protein